MCVFLTGINEKRQKWIRKEKRAIVINAVKFVINLIISSRVAYELSINKCFSVCQTSRVFFYVKLDLFQDIPYRVSIFMIQNFI